MWISLLTAGEHGGGCSTEGDGLRAEGEFLVLYDLCRERLENRVLETALVSCCSAHENHEGGEYNIMILAAVQADLLSTTQHRQNSGRLLFGIACQMLVERGGRIFSALGVCSFLAARLCYRYLIFYYGWAKPMLIVLLSNIMGGGDCDDMILATASASKSLAFVSFTCCPLNVDGTFCFLLVHSIVIWLI